MLIERDLAALEARAFDLVVVGGGIVGVGVAREATLRGLSVALLERTDFASGTSSRTSKLIHGGIRYLETGHLGLVRESCRERTTLLSIAPHLVRPIPFIMPIYRGDRWGPLFLRLGLVLYDRFSGSSPLPRHRMLGVREALLYEPGLRRDGLRGAALFFDAAMDDARLCLEVALAAAERGAAVANYVEVRALQREGNHTVVEAEDRLGGAPLRVRGSMIVNAAGPWIDREAWMPRGRRARRVRPTRGSHLVFPGGDRDHGLVLRAESDGRVYFVLPWLGHTVVGTTDRDYDRDPGAVGCDQQDAQYLLREVRRAVPGGGFRADTVQAAYAGVRPLLRPLREMETEEHGRAPRTTALPGSVNRGHGIFIERGGVLTVVGGKYTTFRRTAAEVVELAGEVLGKSRDELFRRGRGTSALSPLPGAETRDFDAFARKETDRLAAELGLARPEARRLVETYGTRASRIAARMRDDPAMRQPLCPHHPITRAEVAHGVEAEMARTLADVLRRRTDLAFSPCGGLDAAAAAAEVMGGLLGWSAEERERQVHAWSEELALYRAELEPVAAAGR